MNIHARLTLPLATLAVAALLPGAALAANAHFVDGPTITTSRTNVTACGKIAGLGNNQQITVIVEASVTTTCTNRGNNIPSGLTQVVQGEGTFSSGKNGQVTFCVTTEAPVDPCPDRMKPTYSFSLVSIVVLDASGAPILP